MRLTAALLLAAAALMTVLAWQAGLHHALLWHAARQQHLVQDSLAGRIQALRSGDAAAFWSLIGLCAAYGFLHALGPGHGKLLVSGAAIGSRATAARMGLVAVAGSLGQAAVAILLVYGAFALFEVTLRGTMAAADRWIAPLGNLAVAAVGAWLLLRGLRSLRHTLGPAHRHRCSHHHGPGPAEIERAAGPAATAGLIAAMAARPCTGALFVLVLAWRMDVAAAGAAAVLAMGLGTAAFTLIVALVAVTGRDAAFLATGDGRAGRVLAPALQILTGGLILAVSGALVLASIA